MGTTAGGCDSVRWHPLAHASFEVLMFSDDVVFFNMSYHVFSRLFTGQISTIHWKWLREKLMISQTSAQTWSVGFRTANMVNLLPSRQRPVGFSAQLLAFHNRRPANGSRSFTAGNRQYHSGWTCAEVHWLHHIDNLEVVWYSCFNAHFGDYSRRA